MTGEDTRADAVLAALERANPLADGRELEGPRRRRGPGHDAHPSPFHASSVRIPAPVI